LIRVLNSRFSRSFLRLSVKFGALAFSKQPPHSPAKDDIKDNVKDTPVGRKYISSQDRKIGGGLLPGPGQSGIQLFRGHMPGLKDRLGTIIV